MIRPLIYLLFMAAFIKAILDYLKDNWEVISHAPAASFLLFSLGFILGYLWLQREVNANKSENSFSKAEINATKALLELKEEKYLKLEKDLKTKDIQIEDIDKKESKIKVLESDLAMSAKNLAMEKINADFQKEIKTKQNKKINSYIDRLDLLLNINKYHELSDSELQKQASKIITEIKLYYEEADKQLESIMPSDYYSNKINILRSSENYEFDSLLERIKQDFSDKYKNDILLLTEVLISRAGGNKKELTSLFSIEVDNHKKNKPIFNDIESTIFQLENLLKEFKSFRF